MRGDVVEYVPPKGISGSEQAGRRYAVIVQTDSLNLSTCLLSPTSTSVGPTRFRPEIELGDTMTRVLIEQTRPVSSDRLGRMVSRVSNRELREIDRALREMFDLDRR
jgi:mRNA interferase MazF